MKNDAMELHNGVFHMKLTLNFFKCSTNVSVEDSPFKVAADDEAVANVPAADVQAPAPIDSSVDKWFFISAHSL